MGNYLVPGPNSVSNGIAYQESSPNNRGYFAGNYYNNILSEDPWSVVDFSKYNESQITAYKQSKPFETGPVVAQDAKDAYKSVLAQGGASLPRRDAVDRRIVEEVKTGKGHIINSQNEVGGWPDLKSAAAPSDSDGDGMPDEWEKQHNLNPEDASDGSADADGDGYTNVEEYLNSLLQS